MNYEEFSRYRRLNCLTYVEWNKSSRIPARDRAIAKFNSPFLPNYEWRRDSETRRSFIYKFTLSEKVSYFIRNMINRLMIRQK
jgi:hypothetical protein